MTKEGHGQPPGHRPGLRRRTATQLVGDQVRAGSSADAQILPCQLAPQSATILKSIFTESKINISILSMSRCGIDQQPPMEVIAKANPITDRYQNVTFL